MTSFLTNSGRTIKMVGDGNCFYQRISYQLFGTQEEHPTVSSVVYRLENLNKKIFSTYLISGINEATI